MHNILYVDAQEFQFNWHKEASLGDYVAIAYNHVIKL